MSSPSAASAAVLCELACSGGRLGVFDIARSNIQIEMEGTPEIPVPKLKDTCDACGGDPRCIKVCPARVIIWDKDGVRKGMEAKRPGAVKRFFAKLNPFSKTPPPCPTPCGAYPAACPTCDLNTARQTEAVQGETA